MQINNPNGIGLVAIFGPAEPVGETRADRLKLLAALMQESESFADDKPEQVTEEEAQS